MWFLDSRGYSTLPHLSAIFFCLRACICAHACVLVGTYMGAHAPPCASGRGRTRARARVCVCVCVCVGREGCVYLWVCVSVGVYVCIYARVSDFARCPVHGVRYFLRLS
jgi:hypothetical protein